MVTKEHTKKSFKNWIFGVNSRLKKGMIQILIEKMNQISIKKWKLLFWILVTLKVGNISMASPSWQMVTKGRPKARRGLCKKIGNMMC